MTSAAFLGCIRPACGESRDIGEVINRCPACGSLLDVTYDWDRLSPPADWAFFQRRWATRDNPIDYSGVRRFRELLPFAPADALVTIGEGQTFLQAVDVERLGLAMKPGRLHFQYEGLNPSGSFKDNGMAAAFTMARLGGCRRVACASTGNTSASLALYASMVGGADGRPMRGVVFIGAGRIAHGKLSQALDHGALTLQIEGDFDDCLKRIREAADRLGLLLMNSVNPFRLEGQKTIIYRVLEGLAWEVPDWIVVPGGNLGNASAFGKAFMELKHLGLVDRIPRLAIVNAAGANTLYELCSNRGLRWNGGEIDQKIVASYDADMIAAGRQVRTVASAIEIGSPVNLPKALRSLEIMDGVVTEVTDEVILDAKAEIGRCGLGCEPASAASLAGLRRLLDDGVIDRDARVVCILTGHALKDPAATVRYHTGAVLDVDDARKGTAGARGNQPIRVANDLDAICALIERHA